MRGEDPRLCMVSEPGEELAAAHGEGTAATRDEEPPPRAVRAAVPQVVREQRLHVERSRRVRNRGCAVCGGKQQLLMMGSHSYAWSRAAAVYGEGTAATLS